MANSDAVTFPYDKKYYAVSGSNEETIHVCIRHANVYIEQIIGLTVVVAGKIHSSGGTGMRGDNRDGLIDEHLVQSRNPPSVKESSYGTDGWLGESGVLLYAENVVNNIISTWIFNL